MTPVFLSELFPAFHRTPHDIRRRMIAAVFDELDRTGSRQSLGRMSNRHIVRHLIGLVPRCGFRREDFDEFKARMVEDSEPAFRRYAEVLREVLSGLAADRVRILSVGCGSGHLERFLDDALGGRTTCARRWIGLDITEPEADSFFHGRENRYIALHPADGRTYLNIAGEILGDGDTAREAVVVMANFSYHHLDLPFPEFLERCAGAGRVVLLEELINQADWDDGDYRIARIACDLLANIGFNPRWARAFLSDPDGFRVRYPTREEVAGLGGTIVDLDGCSPDLSVVLC
jgi:SAM-dependent methyltransferase